MKTHGRDHECPNSGIICVFGWRHKILRISIEIERVVASLCRNRRWRTCTWSRIVDERRGTHRNGTLAALRIVLRQWHLFLHISDFDFPSPSFFFSVEVKKCRVVIVKRESTGSVQKCERRKQNEGALPLLRGCVTLKDLVIDSRHLTLETLVCKGRNVSS